MNNSKNRLVAALQFPFVNRDRVSVVKKITITKGGPRKITINPSDPQVTCGCPFTKKSRLTRESRLKITIKEGRLYCHIDPHRAHHFKRQGWLPLPPQNIFTLGLGYASLLYGKAGLEPGLGHRHESLSHSLLATCYDLLHAKKWAHLDLWL